MIGKGPRPPRIAPPPQVHHSRKVYERSPRPEPRLRDKHALNAPIVTIFGAGVAGMTAAHELVERGFIVQVVEAQEDVYSPNRPLVGGMAANQRARVRANVEDLHRDVLHASWQEDGESQVARWLLELFTLNRSRWLSTEPPQLLHHSLFTRPTEPRWADFRNTLVESLRRARSVYRKQWLWDLIVRGVMLGAVRYEDAPTRDQELLTAKQIYDELVQQDDTAELARRLHRLQSEAPSQRPEELPDRALLDRCMDALVVPALEREFLCFRLIPQALRGYAEAPNAARELYVAWSEFFRSLDLARNYVWDDPEQPIYVAETETPPELPVDPMAWLQLDVIEQRLPGEHGYRFFPSFYHHLEDTMRRIPLFIGRAATGRSVADNLRPTVFQGIGFSPADRRAIAELGGEVSDQYDDPPLCAAERKPASTVVVELHRDRALSLEGIRERTDRFVERIGGTRRDALLLLARLVRFMTSSPERRRAEYERQTWANFLKKEQFSPAMQQHIQSAAQALLAFSASEADARTYGNVALQMLLDQLDDGTRVDRTLNGPTSDAWLEPWREYLERHGVRFFRRRLARLKLTEEHGLVPEFDPPPGVSNDGTVEKILSQDGYQLLTHDQRHGGLQPDFYVLALSLEETRRLLQPLQPDPARAPDFHKLLLFSDDVDERRALKTMTGVQFFFDAKTSIGRGHMYFPFSEWGLSSISQSEFWSARGGFSDGYFGVLSVDVCHTGAENGGDPGSFWRVLRHGGDASEQAPGDDKAPRLLVARKVWEQISSRISTADEIAHPRCYHLDRMVSEHGNCSKYLACVAELDTNRPGRSGGPLCVGADEIRYSLNYDRWVSCGTYMATHTRMTTMESANESARHAVRTILQRLTMDDSFESRAAADAEEVPIENRRNRTYNGASPLRVYDLPDTWNLEDLELEDLDIFRRVDRRLLALGLGHFMDIIDFDEKLKHALDTIKLYGAERPLPDLLGTSLAGLDALLAKELGRGYESELGSKLADAQASVSKLQGVLPDSMFDDMKGLLGRLHELIRALTPQPDR